jgi:nucleoside-diphosphate-sugar epimerase
MMSATRHQVLIIGGTRFFGLGIARTLLLDGHDVTVFTRGRSHLFPDGATHVTGDRTQQDQLADAISGREFDVVIDMIAYRGDDSLAAIELFDGHVDHFIHISTASVYAVLRELPSPVREEHYDGEVKHPDRSSRGHEYGMGKRACEDALWEAHASSGFPVTTLRLPIVLGEGDYTLRAQSYFLRILDGEPLILPDSGQNPMSFVYQGDVVDFVSENLCNDPVIGEAFNLAQDEIPTVRSFVEQAARFMERQVAHIDIPVELLKRAGYAFTASPFTSRRPFILTNEKAKRLVGFTPTPMSDWLRRTVRHFTEEGPTQVPSEYENRELELEIIDAWRTACERFQVQAVDGAEID